MTSIIEAATNLDFHQVIWLLPIIVLLHVLEELPRFPDWAHKSLKTGATGGAWYDGAAPASQSARRPGAKTPIAGLYMSGVKAFAGGGMQPAMMGGLMAAQAVLGE